MYNEIIEYNYRPSKYQNLLPCICHCLSNRMKREYSNKCYFNRIPNVENHDKVERHALLQ